MAIIHLTKGFVSIVDDDSPAIGIKWQANLTKNPLLTYAVHNSYFGGKVIKIYMHRFLLNAQIGVDVDHINNDPLDNRLCNLRIATRGQNNANSRHQKSKSGFRGVNKAHHGGKWQAKIKSGNSVTLLGSFPTPEMAAMAYDRAALNLFGEFATLNFPTESPK